jgi:hypothetical protein
MFFSTFPGTKIQAPSSISQGKGRKGQDPGFFKDDLEIGTLDALSNGETELLA